LTIFKLKAFEESLLFPRKPSLRNPVLYHDYIGFGRYEPDMVDDALFVTFTYGTGF